MLRGKLRNGRLTDIAYRDQVNWEDGGQDVEVSTMPTDFGPFTYDAANKLAIPAPTENDRLDRIGGRFLLALAMRLSSEWPSGFKVGQRQRIQAIIDEASAQGKIPLDDN